MTDRHRTAPAMTFVGAARSVGGSMHLIEAAGRRWLLDCGSFRSATPNAPFAFDPTTLDAVVLTHAHTDHCGSLPALVRHGFDGPIYCTHPTRDLAELMLLDSARKHEENAPHRGEALGHTRAYVYEVADRMETVGYGEPFGLDGACGVFSNAGHILGSAALTLRFDTGERLHFTGDLGRRDVPMLPPPEPLPAADAVICESTYGDRLHAPIGETVARLEKIVCVTVERGGKVIVPAFSLGRTQLILHVLLEARRAGRIPAIPLVMDTPLGQSIADVHQRYRHLLVDDLEANGPFLRGDGLIYPSNSDESQLLSLQSGPAVLVASSGMCEGGRVVHHLRTHIDDPRCSVVLVSFQAPNTAGRRLAAKGPTVRLGQTTYNKWAEVHELQGFSGHADRVGFLEHFAAYRGATPKVRLVHGEPDQAEALARHLTAAGLTDVAVPGPGETELVAGG